MGETPKSRDKNPASVLPLAIFLVLAGGAMAAWAINGVMHGRLEDGIELFILSAVPLGVSGYLFFVYFIWSRRPEFRPGAPEGIRRVSEPSKRPLGQIIRIAGLPLGIISIAYGIFLLASGRPGGVFQTALGAGVILIWLQYTRRNGSNGSFLNDMEEGGPRD